MQKLKVVFIGCGFRGKNCFSSCNVGKRCSESIGRLAEVEITGEEPYCYLWKEGPWDDKEDQRYMRDWFRLVSPIEELAIECSDV